MRDYKLNSLGNLLGGALSRHGIGERVIAAQIVASANELLTDMLAPGPRSEVQAISYKNAELLIVCKTPTARYAAEGLIKSLGRQLEVEFPSQTFKKIICLFKPLKANDDEWYNGGTV